MLLVGEVNKYFEPDKEHKGFSHAIDIQSTPKPILEKMLEADKTHVWLYGTHMFSDLEEIKKLVEKK